jgi:hypothetical protein
MKKSHLFLLCLLLVSQLTFAQYQLEKLNRGLVAVRTGSNNFVSWRFLGTEEDNITFNLYRNGTKVNTNPLTVTNYTDNGAATTAQYYVRAVVNNVEQTASETVSVWGQNYLQIPLQIPAGGTTPDNVAYTYEANDCSIGDVDGDGIYEIFLKWYPTNAKDNSQSGNTGNCLIDCYKLNGTRLWRIDLGINIRSGAHYTQFMVYDFDGDGKAEMACKTADGSKDATGTIIGSSTADHRNTSGYVLAGPEFLTMFSGETGKILQTINYNPARGTVNNWGDNYGNRVDRFLAGVAYLDGKKPSLIMCRGYYTRSVLVAYDWVNGAFVQRWIFDSNTAGSQYTGQGDHSLSIGDVDNDNKQEIIYGAMVIDDNGTALYNTGFGHGDALHVSDFDPNNPGLEIFNIQEQDRPEDCYLYSALQKKVIWQTGATGGEGPGRGCAGNVTETNAGSEYWVSGGQTTGGPWKTDGASAGITQPNSTNFLIWWDGDLARDLLDGNTIKKYPNTTLLTASGCSSNNGSKSTPALSGDILGDWREELIERTSDNAYLRIYTTTTASTHKIRTLVHDAHYRVALAWQNTAYNQPPHPSFYLGDGVALPAKPSIAIVGSGTNNNSCSATATSNGTTAYCGSQTISTSITASAGVSYVWQKDGQNLGGATGQSYTATSVGSYTVSVTNASNCTATSNAIVISANAGTAITPYLQVNGGAWQGASTTTLCAGGSVLIGPQPVVTTGWSWTGPNNFTATTREITLSNLNTSGNYTATYNDGTCGTTQVFALTVNQNVNPTIQLISEQGTTLNTWATPLLTTQITNGGTTPTYVWKKNGTIIQGATASSYQASNLVNGDRFEVSVTSNASCLVNTSANSNVVTFQVVTANEGLINGEEFSIYPNPTNDFIHLNESKKWTLLDVYGKVLSEGEGVKIDLTSYQSGFYFLKLGDELIKITKN